MVSAGAEGRGGETRSADGQIPATRRVRACSSVGLKRPGSRSSSSPGSQSDCDGAAAAVGRALEDDRVRVAEVAVESVSHGGGVVGSVSDGVDVALGGPTASVDETWSVVVVSAVWVS